MSLSEVAYQNLLPRALPREDLEYLCPQLEFVVLIHRQVLQHARMPIKHFYFVERGLVSVVAKTGAGKAVEVWSVGRDGVVGLARLVGQKIPLNKYVVEVDGAAFRIGVEALEAKSSRPRVPQKTLVQTSVVSPSTDSALEWLQSLPSIASKIGAMASHDDGSIWLQSFCHYPGRSRTLARRSKSDYFRLSPRI